LEWCARVGLPRCRGRGRTPCSGKR